MSKFKKYLIDILEYIKHKLKVFNQKIEEKKALEIRLIAMKLIEITNDSGKVCETYYNKNEVLYYSVINKCNWNQNEFTIKIAYNGKIIYRIKIIIDFYSGLVSKFELFGNYNKRVNNLIKEYINNNI